MSNCLKASARAFVAVSDEQVLESRAGSGKGNSNLRAFASAKLGPGRGRASATAHSRVAETMLFSVEPVDPVTYGFIAMIIMAGFLVAAYGPAR